MAATKKFTSGMPSNEIYTYFPQEFHFTDRNGMEIISRPFNPKQGVRELRFHYLLGEARIRIREHHDTNQISYEICGGWIAARRARSRLSRILGLKLEPC